MQDAITEAGFVPQLRNQQYEWRIACGDSRTGYQLLNLCLGWWKNKAYKSATQRSLIILLLLKTKIQQYEITRR